VRYTSEAAAVANNNALHRITIVLLATCHYLFRDLRGLITSGSAAVKIFLVLEILINDVEFAGTI